MSESPSARFLTEWDGMEEFEERGGELQEKDYGAVNIDRNSIDDKLSVYQTHYSRPKLVMEANYDDTEWKIFDYEPGLKDILKGEGSSHLVQATTEEDVNEAVGGMNYRHRIIGLIDDGDLRNLESLFFDDECTVEIYRGDNPDIIG